MATDRSSELLPILNNGYRGFDPAMRGYDRTQVDAYVASLDEDLRITTGERDLIAARSADIAAQLASTQAQIESLRRQLRAATETVTAENVDTRVAQMMKTAQSDVAKLRSEVEEQAEVLRNGAADSAARTRAAAQAAADRIVADATARLAEADATFGRRLAEVEQHRNTIEQELALRIEQTRAEEDRLTSEAETERTRLNAEAEAERTRLNAEALAERTRLNAEALAERTGLNAEALAERTRLDAESSAERSQADEDFELTLRLRRTAEYRALADERTTTAATIARDLSAARAEAARIVEEATSEVRRLDAIREQAHADLRELGRRLGEALDLSLAAAPPPRDPEPGGTGVAPPT